MAKGSKIGRNKRKASNKQYLAEKRWEKNKQKSILKQAKRIGKKKEKLAKIGG